MIFQFKKANPDANKRKADSNKLHEKYPERIPIICEKDPKSKIVEIEQNKFLVPNDLIVSQFEFLLRKRMEIEKSTSLLLLVNGKHSIAGDSTLNEIYERYKDAEDGFLYISYTSELIWG